jgi:uncharacterized protein YndB with AHSA1/START domain
MTSQPAAIRELMTTRLIDAPPEHVYRIWAERLGEWWMPRPYTTPRLEIDLRPGGRFLTVMRTPDGTEMETEGVFLEVEPNRRIVFTDAFRVGWIPQDTFMVVILTFEPEGSGTRYTARARHWSEEALKQHEAMGFHEGWAIVAGQLAQLAEGGSLPEVA